MLGHHLISSFTSSLSSSLRQAALDSMVGDKSGLLVTFTSNVKVYFNDEGTRGFIAIQVSFDDVGTADFFNFHVICVVNHSSVEIMNPSISFNVTR